MNDIDKSKLEQFLASKTDKSKNIQIDAIIEEMRRRPEMKGVFEEYERKNAEREAIQSNRKMYIERLKNAEQEPSKTLDIEKALNEAKTRRDKAKKEMEQSDKEAKALTDKLNSIKSEQHSYEKEAKSYLTKTCPREFSQIGKIIYKLIDKNAYRDAVHQVFILTPATTMVLNQDRYNEVEFTNEPAVNDLGNRMKSAYEEFLNAMYGEITEKVIEEWRTRAEAFQNQYENLKNQACVRETIHPNQFMERLNRYKSDLQNKLNKQNRPAEKSGKITGAGLFGMG